MAIETTFSDIQSGFSVSGLFYDAALKEQGRESFIAWFNNQISQWTHFSTLFESLGTSERLLEALCHTSFTHENTSLSVKSYERLEFLGDAVLDLIVSKTLLDRYSELDEGPLSKLRGSLVNEDSLARLARSVELGSVILLGKGEFQNGGGDKEAILADAVESTLAVFYLEKGEAAAVEYLNLLISEYEKIHDVNFFDLSHMKSFDSKTRLQEKTMALVKEHPVYSSTSQEDGSFDVVVSLKGHEIAMMNHVSKKKAEKLLAQKILDEKLYEEVTNVN